MDQNLLNQRYNNWGFLILLNSPENIEIGIDNISWKTGHKFKGIKLIPPGPHIIYYALKQEKYQFKISFFINITQENRFVIKKWNEQFQDFVSVPESEKDKYIFGVKDYSLDKYLGPYPYEKFSIWAELSNFISQKVIDKLNPIEKKVHIQDQEYESEQNKNLNNEIQKEKTKEIINNLYGEDFGEIDQNEDENNLENEKKQFEQFAKEMDEKLNLNLKKEQFETAKEQEKKIREQNEKEDFNAIAGTIYYTQIPRKLLNHGKQGSELTEISMDKTSILVKLLQQDFENDYKQFLGEMQYAFSSFLLGENYDSFEQWKHMIYLSTNCDKFMQENSEFGVDLIPCIYGMLKQFPKDFFMDIISKDNFLKSVLSQFLEVCLEQESNKKLKSRAKKLQKMLEEKFMIFINDFKVIQNEKGQYQFEMQDEDCPELVDTEDMIDI